ncbi:unnamed protein product [Lymnaea stagnalis]|uniref:Uncharacterized protein n=1 Tax=Lymnaea stagnalis TaxID=6523 RepID=A0AAV2I4I5_LYMST
MHILIVSTLILGLDLAAAQFHVGVLNTVETTLTCYNCDGHGHLFPACLAAPITCRPGEVCSVTYGHGQPIIKCIKEVDCSRAVAHPLGVCTGGGAEISHERCELCCKTNACVTDISLVLQPQLGTHTVDLGLFCPGQCSEIDLSTCVKTGTHCAAGQFCRVDVNALHAVQGQCLNNHEHQKCLDDQAKRWCVNAVGTVSSCVLDCCETTSCLDAHFGAYMGNTIGLGSGTGANVVLATGILTPAPTPAQTPAPTQAPVLATTHVAAQVDTQGSSSHGSNLPTGAITCTACTGGTCHSDPYSVACPSGFCLKTVHNYDDGQIIITKSCGDAKLCETYWWAETKPNKECMDQLLWQTNPRGELFCYFCCASGPNCNDHLNDVNNLFRFS